MPTKNAKRDAVAVEVRSSSRRVASIYYYVVDGCNVLITASCYCVKIIYGSKVLIKIVDIAPRVLNHWRRGVTFAVAESYKENMLIQSIRYQVFVSSTFTDLKEERAEVLQAIWELDCIPTGMEAFLATNESQWEVIKKVIDECDYYVLIMGGRYGSITPEGISYTEKEYNYAKSLGIPVLCFVHGEPGSIPTSKSESDEAGRLKLETFRARVMKEHPVRSWTSPQELGGLVSRSMSRAIKVAPRPGWIRNVGPSNVELLEQVNELAKENAILRDRLVTSSGFGIKEDDLASGEDIFTIEGSARKTTLDDRYGLSAKYVSWKAHAAWDEIFRDVGPLLMNEATEDEISETLARFSSWSQELDRKKDRILSVEVSMETKAEVIVQFRALGLVEKGQKKRAVSDKGSYWALTEKGERRLVGLLAKRKIDPKLRDLEMDIDEI